MSLVDEFMTPRRRWQVTENLKLARRFFQEYLEEPAVFNDANQGRPWVLLPSDDAPNTELTLANLDMAKEMSNMGRPAAVYAVGIRPKGQPIPSVQIRMAWPPMPRRNVYSREADTLTLDFSDLQPLVTVTPVHPLSMAIVDTETHQLLQLVISRFLAEASRQAPQLLQSLVTSPAELVGISREELVRILEGQTAEGDPIWTSFKEGTG